MRHNATYDLQSFIPQDWRGWDNYRNRLSRYEVLTGYYFNIAYHGIVTYSQGLKHTEKLYKHVRGVYNPVKRLVDGYVSKVYGGVLDTQNAEAGAIPISTENEALPDAITRLWLNSQWGQKKSLYTRYGARTGDAFIKVVDDIHKQQVRLEVVDPMKVKTVKSTSDGTVEYVEFEYYIERNDKFVLYRETITPDRWTAQDENGVAVHQNGRNEGIVEWDNPYGFVPFVHTQHIDEGLGYGAPASHGLLHKINELNDLASILNDGMRKQVQLPLVSINARIGALDLGEDQSQSQYNTSDNPKKDTMGVLNLVGQDASLQTLAPTINIQDGLANIVEILQEIERDSPELSLHRMRQGGNLTAPGVRSAYDDAISRYAEVRGNYDTGLVVAEKMGVAIGGMRGYDGFKGFNLASLMNGSVDHQIADRPVINDSMSLVERQDYTLRGMQQNAPKIYYTQMGWTESQADEIVTSAQSQRDSLMMTSPFEQATTTDPLDDPDASPQDAFDTRLNSGVNENDLLNADALMAEAV